MPLNRKQLTQCLSCGSKKIKHIVKDRTYFNKNGKKIVIPKIPHEKCFSCGERFFGSDSFDIIEPFLEKNRCKKRKAVI